MQTRTPQRQPKRLRLLPHERWLADLGARRGPSPPGSDRWRMHQNYGLEGSALQLAGVADMLPGALITVAGSGLQFLTDSIASYYLMAIGAFVILVGFVRLFQASRADRHYRNGRPYLRPHPRSVSLMRVGSPEDVRVRDTNPATVLTYGSARRRGTCSSPPLSARDRVGRPTGGGLGSRKSLVGLHPPCPFSREVACGGLPLL